MTIAYPSFTPRVAQERSVLGDAILAGVKGYQMGKNIEAKQLTIDKAKRAADKEKSIAKGEKLFSRASAVSDKIDSMTNKWAAETDLAKKAQMAVGINREALGFGKWLSDNGASEAVLQFFGNDIGDPTDISKQMKTVSHHIQNGLRMVQGKELIDFEGRGIDTKKKLVDLERQKALMAAGKGKWSGSKTKNKVAAAVAQAKAKGKLNANKKKASGIDKVIDKIENGDISPSKKLSLAAKALGLNKKSIGATAKHLFGLEGNPGDEQLLQAALRLLTNAKENTATNSEKLNEIGAIAGIQKSSGEPLLGADISSFFK